MSAQVWYQLVDNNSMHLILKRKFTESDDFSYMTPEERALMMQASGLKDERAAQLGRPDRVIYGEVPENEFVEQLAVA
jgi:hypothetical protein